MTVQRPDQAAIQLGMLNEVGKVGIDMRPIDRQTAQVTSELLDMVSVRPLSDCRDAKDVVARQAGGKRTGNGMAITSNAQQKLDIVLPNSGVIDVDPLQ